MNYYRFLILFSSVLLCLPLLSQQTPCYKKKKICDYSKIKSCYELVNIKEEKYAETLRNLYPFSGSCTKCYRNGVFQEHLIFITGKRNGKDTSYYNSGCPQSVQTYIMGIKHDTITQFYDSTYRIKSMSIYFNGKKYGPSFQLDSKGDTIIYQEFANNLPSGVKREYYEESKIKKIVHYKNGILDGNHKTYNQKGELQLEFNYLDGQNHGAQVMYHDNNVVMRKENWKKGNKHGDFITYTPLNKIMSEKYFKNNVPTGTHKEYYPDGKEKHVLVFGKKGVLVEEYLFDNFGVKTIVNHTTEKKKKCGSKRKKEEGETGGATID